MKKPSEFHSDLQEGHILSAIKLITSAYADAVDNMREDKGDTNWGLGCRRYEWAKQNLRQAAESGKYPFLSILVDTGNTFLFKIGAVPVRFKRCDAENANPTIFSQYHTEAAQLSLLQFDNLNDPCMLSWRILVDVDLFGDVTTAVFVGAEQNGRTQCFWQAPLESLHMPPALVPSSKPEGVVIAPPKVSLKSPSIKTKNEDISK